MSTLLRKVRVALTPRAFLLRRRLSNGAIVYGQNRRGFGGRGIYVYGDAIEPEFRVLERILAPGGVFVDVGANTGIYTIKAARHYGARGTVVALEPFPDVFAMLYKNVCANDFHNVRLRCCCAGARTGAGTLWLNHGAPNSFSLVKRQEDALALSTLTVKLDDLLGWEGLEGLDYLKVDAEGAEAAILEGAMESIERYRPIIQLEVIINEVSVSFPGYRRFRAPSSPNIVYVPSDHPRMGVFESLGWRD